MHRCKTYNNLAWNVYLTEYSLGYGTLQGTLQSKTGTISDVNFYRSPSQNDEDIYKSNVQHNIPKGAYPSNPEHSHYDGRYVYDHEAPPRPPLPVDAGLWNISCQFWARSLLAELLNKFT